MLGNSIAGSLWSGFDLGADGVSVNDPGDGDTGPNGLLNVPVLDAVSYAAGAGSSSTTPSTYQVVRLV